ncbi:MAG TPA: nuclear transport factor 2 family protein [Nocardioidaceae bacterium]
MSQFAAETLVDAIARHDAAALVRVLAPDVDFRGLTPGRFWEAHSPDEVVDVVLGSWFAESDHIDEVTSVEHGDDVGDTHRLAYRFSITNPDGSSTVEQQVYYRTTDGRLSYLRVVCSGFRPRAEVAS